MSKWRLIAALLVALGLVLPLSTCTRGDPPTTEYHYALGDAVNNPSCVGLCRVGVLSLTLAAFLWPFAACAAARRITGRKGTIVRLCIEPLLLGSASWWLYWEIFLRDPAIGSVSGFSGFILYAAIWLFETAKVIRSRTRVIDPQSGSGKRK
jgi:hypothetical protein